MKGMHIALRPITEAWVSCKCGWKGTIGQCISVDHGDGELGCPKCGAEVNTKQSEVNPCAN